MLPSLRWALRNVSWSLLNSIPKIGGVLFLDICFELINTYYGLSFPPDVIYRSPNPRSSECGPWRWGLTEAIELS